ncbi:NB-ARC domain-containing protein [Micromonospora chersina]|uniref:NB-ARC domain-containing protein n=1 Tax=Micromonospora chersina TaxID=47854 RepID=UPI003723F033
MSRADPSESVAVLIGVGRYQTDFPDVPQAVSGVRLLAEQFASPDLWGVPRPSRLFELLNPDRATVLRTVGDAARLVRPPGMLVIYFAGHAEPFGDQLCLAMTDADRSRPGSSMVAAGDLVDEVRRNGPRDTRTVLVLDCCYAGQAAGSIPVKAVSAAEATGWYFIGAVNSGTPADAGKGRETTAFTEMFLRVIQGRPEAGATLRAVDVFEGLTALLPQNPPVHNNAAAGTAPWLVNRAYRPPAPTPVDLPGNGRPVRARPRMVPPIANDMVKRQTLIRQLLDEITNPTHAGPVAVTAVHGTGGFGKTVLTIQACHDPSIDARFPGGVLWTELGQEIHGPALASKINDMTERLTGVRPTLADPQAAGFHLGEALDACSQSVLLVVDDVWHDEQIRPFLTGGRRCRRVVTTRFSLSALAAAKSVAVDVMAEEEAIAVLIQNLQPLPAEVTDRLLRLTGRWPLLLGIANRTIARSRTPTRPVDEAARMVADRLEGAGPTGLDNPWTGSTSSNRALVTASVDASLQSLPTFVRDRYFELGIFAEDTDIPYTVLSLLWTESGGLDTFQTEQLGQTLIDASLATPARDEPGLRLHDVLRTYLRDAAGPEQRTRTNNALVNAAAYLLPGTGGQNAPAGHNNVRSWWLLPAEYDYLWRHLADHLTDAGLQTERDRLLVDLRWIAARIRRDGPVHAETDLTHTAHPAATALAHAIRRNAHLLGPITPATAIDDILASRLDGKPGLQDLVDKFTSTLTHRPRIANHWPPSDQPDPALIRAVHSTHPYGLSELHIAPDGSWLATVGSSDPTRPLGGDPVVRIWDPATGRQRRQFDTGHRDGVGQVYIAPDSTWLATTGCTDGFGRDGDLIVKIWDPVTGAQRHQLDTGHRGGLAQVHIAPDGTWLVTSGPTELFGNQGDPVIKIWDPVTGTQRHQLDTGHRGGVGQVHIAPDGTWLATTAKWSGDPAAKIWDPNTGGQRHELDTGNRDGVGQVHIAPDGTWLATTVLIGPHRGEGAPVVRCDPVRIWDPATGHQRHQLNTGHRAGRVDIAPDGTWLATTASPSDPLIEIWDPVTGVQHHQLDTGHRDGVGRVHIAPDSTWLATTGSTSAFSGGDPVVQIWDPVTGRRLHQLDTGHRDGVGQLHIAPDSTWLATTQPTFMFSTARGDAVVRIWDPVNGGQPHQLDTGHRDRVGQLHIAPDSSWLATTSYSRDPIFRIWDPRAGGQRHPFDTGHSGGVGQLCTAPDGTWLATTGYSTDDPVMRIWDPVSGRRLHQLDTGHPDGVGQLCTAPDGAWLATTGHIDIFGAGGSDPVVRIWDPATGHQRHRLDTGHSRGVRQVHIAPDGTWLATTGPTDVLGVGDNDSVLRIWDPATGHQRHQLDTGHSRGVGQVHIAPDGTWLATSGPTGGPGGDPDNHDPVVRIWDPETGRQRHQLHTSHSYGVEQVHIAPDATWLATTGRCNRFGGMGDPVVSIWDPETGRQRHQFDTGHRDGVRQLRIAPDSTWLATTGRYNRFGGDSDPVVRIWDPETGRQRHQFDTGQSRGIGQMHIAPDGTWLATTRYLGGDPVAQIWDPVTGSQRHRLDTGQNDQVQHVHIAEDGSFIIVVGFTSVAFILTVDGRATAIRLDCSVDCSELLDHGPVLLLGGSRGLYAFELIHD